MGDHPDSFARTLRVGTINTGRKSRAVVTVEISWTAPGEPDPYGNPPTDTGSLSISGYAQRPRAKDIDEGGQMQNTIRDMEAAELDISGADRRALLDVWNTYHLNTLSAGCEHQRAFGWHAARAYSSSPTSDEGRAYVEALEALEQAPAHHEPRADCYVCKGLSEPGASCYHCHGGEPLEGNWRRRTAVRTLRRLLADELRDDVGTPCPICGYRYGHEWKKAPVPADVVLWLRDELGKTPRERLEYLRAELRAERISYAELAELQELAEHIEPGDVELLEAAGVPEFADDEGGA